MIEIIIIILLFLIITVVSSLRVTKLVEENNENGFHLSCQLKSTKILLICLMSKKSDIVQEISVGYLLLCV